MTVTDIATFILSFFFLMRGASRGFMKSLTGPFSVIVGTIISIIYYQATNNTIVSLLIGLIGPIFLNLLLKFLLKTWAMATNSDIRPGFLSCMAGSILTLIWGWVFIIFILLLLVVLPPWGEALQAVHNDVIKSKSYLIIKPLEKYLVPPSKSDVTSDGSKDHEDATTGPVDAKSLAEDPRFQKILQDPDIQKQINTHDIAGLMRNPKMMKLVQQIMNDPATMKKVLAIYRNQAQPQVSASP